MGNQACFYLAVTEKEITAKINKIYSEAFKADDYRTMKFLDWFIAEQMEEETNAREIVQLLKITGDSGAALYLADIQMSKRKDE